MMDDGVYGYYGGPVTILTSLTDVFNLHFSITTSCLPLTNTMHVSKVVQSRLSS